MRALTVENALKLYFARIGELNQTNATWNFDLTVENVAKLAA